jgi:hypothetical protein
MRLRRRPPAVVDVPSVTCPIGHRVTRFDVQGCDAGHEHRVYVCPMRLGRTACGALMVVPPYGEGCEEE